MWLTTGEGEMLLEQTEIAFQSDGYEWVEIVDLSVHNGIMGTRNVLSLPESRRVIVPSEFTGGKFIIVSMIDRSMEDGDCSIHEGSHIMVKELENPNLRAVTLALPNNLYLIVVKGGILFRQIIK